MAIENLEQLNRVLDRFSKGITPARLVQLHKVISLQILSGVIFRTPVDEGVARGGWQTGLDFIPEGNTGRADDAVAAEESEAYSRGVASLSGLTKIGQTVYVVNNVEYIIYLEEGKPGPGSDQAPEGMVFVTIQDVLEQFK